MKTSSVSVAIATYNGARYLREQLISIANQTVLPHEVIISDDGSTDGTLQVVESFAQSAPFVIKILRNEENLGYAQNFSRALQACSGEIVFLCDQDDVWLPYKIEFILADFEKHKNIVLVVHDLEFCTENLVPIGQTKLARMSTDCDIQRDYVVGMATAVRQSFLRLCLPVPNLPGVAHDRWLHDCAWAVGRKFVRNEVLALYRRHAENATGTKSVNVDYVTNRLTFLWARFREPSNIRGMKSIPDSPVASWLLRQRQVLIAAGYLTEPGIDVLICQENLRTDALRERKRILGLPRWRRVWGIAKLLRAKKYQEFFSLWSAIKDLVVR